jgi:hypothetical protein
VEVGLPAESMDNYLTSYLARVSPVEVGLPAESMDNYLTSYLARVSPVEVGLPAESMDNYLTSYLARVSLVEVGFILFLCVCFFYWGLYQWAMAFAGGSLGHCCLGCSCLPLREASDQYSSQLTTLFPFYCAILLAYAQKL